MITDLPLVGTQSEDSGTGDSSGGGTKGSTLFWQRTGRFKAFNTLVKKEWIPLLFLHSSAPFFVTKINKLITTIRIQLNENSCNFTVMAIWMSLSVMQLYSHLKPPISVSLYSPPR